MLLVMVKIEYSTFGLSQNWSASFSLVLTQGGSHLKIALLNNNNRHQVYSSGDGKRLIYSWYPLILNNERSSGDSFEVVDPQCSSV